MSRVRRFESIVNKKKQINALKFQQHPSPMQHLAKKLKENPDCTRYKLTTILYRFKSAAVTIKEYF